MAAKKVSEAQIIRAREIDLLSYLEAKGEKFKREGKYYRHQEHDSLVIKENAYVWNSKGEKGYGAISFAQMYYDMSFIEAVEELNRDEFLPLKKVAKVQEKKQPFSYPIHLEINNQSKIKNYLIHERKINQRLVEWLIRKDLIAQDKNNNLVFKWKENGGKGKIIGAELQGTVRMKNKRGSFKHIMKNNRENTGFTIDIGKPELIYYFECPIDLLSYWCLKHENLQNARLVSMSGLKMKTVLHSYMEAKRDGCNVKGLVLCVDNDKAGLHFCECVEEIARKDVFHKDLPEKEGADWNNILKAKVKKQQFLSLTKEEDLKII